MYEKSILEPIEDGSELNEGKEGGGEFVVTSADAAMAFDPAEEVFDPVTTTIEPSGDGREPTQFFRRGMHVWPPKYATRARRASASKPLSATKVPPQQANVFVCGADVVARP